MSTRSMFVVFDLDGTLALNEHRQHFVQREVGKKDWKSFFEACDKDMLFWQVARILEVLVATGNRVEIWSGRSGEVIDKTKAWLAQHGLNNVPLRCRPAGDHTPDHELKKLWLDESSLKPDLVFDDRSSMVAMWRANGIACAQVADGNF